MGTNPVDHMGNLIAVAFDPWATTVYVVSLHECSPLLILSDVIVRERVRAMTDTFEYFQRHAQFHTTCSRHDSI